MTSADICDFGANAGECHEPYRPGPRSTGIHCLHCGTGVTMCNYCGRDLGCVEGRWVATPHRCVTWPETERRTHERRRP